MIFVANRDFEPHGNFYDYCLGRMIHDDGDVIKWDWTIYKAVREEDFTEEKCLTLLSEHGIVYT